MNEKGFTRFICWDKQPLSKVINTEAVSVDKHIFLATHAPFNSITYVKSPRQIKDTSETQLLKEMFQRGHSDEHTFIIMQGIPGTGKSHLIRWLKEQYIVENQEIGGNDVILLIERANSSLRQTLTQIINSGLFNSKRFANQVKKLESATQQLSDESLSDTILNNLQVATREVDVPAPRRIKGKVEKFLLDYFIRQELKKDGAAIERIRLFLSGKSDSIGLADNEFPKFNAEDFEFSINVLRSIRDEGGHRDAKDLAETLNHRVEKRQELAEYLNQLIPFAIERTTALSANDLKQMFYDLRRELKQQGKNLVLFIEDISVFTGLDAGLVDVLVTQHTGESGNEYCRLTSVVGVTDAYFKDSFPDNIKQRVTHHLTLNVGAGQKQSQLLNNAQAVADLVARYLNALRLNQQELEEWVRIGARPKELPNACRACQHRAACHAAFGVSALGDSDDEQLQIGLYPFNKRSLWTLYERLNTAKVSKTPRTLLGSILEYILQSHGQKIKAGLFPPPARELASDVRPPTLYKKAQRRLITDQTKSSTIADRIESLVLFWGDRTVDQISISGKSSIGKLDKIVFRAFGLPFIQGDVTATASISTSSPQVTKTKKSQSLTPERTEKSRSTTHNLSTVQDSINDPFVEDIEEWRRGSELKNYRTLAQWLADFAKESIDWEAHQISPTLVYHSGHGRIRQSRFVIEGQKAKKGTSDHLLFERTDDLAFVLQALTALHKRADTIAPDEIGGHLTTLSNWMTQHEARIVEFVRRPLKDMEPPKPLLELLVQTNLLISCLGEDLTASKKTPRELYFCIMKKPDKQNSWSTLISRSPYPRSGDWRDIMRGIQRYAIRGTQNSSTNCRDELLILTNCRQGGSRDIRFIDAADVLDIIKRIKKDDWVLPPLPLDKIIASRNIPWVVASTTYTKLQERFVTTIKNERQHVQAVNDRLCYFLGENTPEEVFQAISTVLGAFRENAIAFRFTVNESLTYRKLTNRLESLQAVLNSKETEDLALALSGAGELLRETLAYVDYFERFAKLVEQKEENLREKIGRLESERIDDNQYQETIAKYQTLEHLLEPIITEAGETIA